MERNLWKRIMIGVSVPAMLVLLCIYEYQGGNGCPGCGSGRAVNALFHGRFAEAVSYNILLPILGIPCLFVLAHEYLRIVFPKMKLRPVSISQRSIETSGVLKPRSIETSGVLRPRSIETSGVLRPRVLRPLVGIETSGVGCHKMKYPRGRDFAPEVGISGFLRRTPEVGISPQRSGFRDF